MFVTVLRISRALASFLDYEPTVELREGLQRTIDWWKKSRFANFLNTS